MDVFEVPTGKTVPITTGEYLVEDVTTGKLIQSGTGLSYNARATGRYKRDEGDVTRRLFISETPVIQGSQYTHAEKHCIWLASSLEKYRYDDVVDGEILENPIEIEAAETSAVALIPVHY